MPKLLIHPSAPDKDGRIHHVTPQTAGWTYVGFDVHRLAAGQSVSAETLGREACLVMVSGTARISAGALDAGEVGGRGTPFAGLPDSVYCPARSSWRVTAAGECEVAVCSAPAQGKMPPRRIGPADIAQETRGHGTNTRYVRDILPESAPFAESLLVVEVITPGGHWSSYPAHKHDTENFPHETLLEETYYHQLARGAGYAFQRVYSDDLSLDETMAPGHRDVVLVPRGYHPVSAAHGFDLWYLNVMAGPLRKWRTAVSPDHAFLLPPA